MAKKKWYSVYQGDNFIVQGDVDIITKYLGISVSTFNFYLTSTYRKRQTDYDRLYTIIRFDEDE